jgi:DNA-binding transcriptional LysR family regulator
MSMNLSWLEDFFALQATGNFSRAAQERHMTQPAFSRRVRALEEWTGTDLFDRSSHPVTLTPAGVWFQGVAQELMARVARIPGEAKAVADAQSATLRFAATHALSFTFLPGWLRGLESRTTVGPITLVSDVMARCEAKLLEGRVQFMLSHAHGQVTGRLATEGYAFVRVGTDLLIPVSAPQAHGRPLHHADRATRTAPLQLLTYSAESGIGRIVRELRGTTIDRLPTHSVFTAHLASVLRSMALDGRGLAWLPRSLIADDLAAGRLVEAAPAEWSVALEVRLYRDRSPLGEAGEAFWSVVQHLAAAPDGGVKGPPSR